MAQLGSAPGLGPGSRRFESSYPDVDSQIWFSSRITVRASQPILTVTWRSSSTVRAPPCQGGRWQFESALRRCEAHRKERAGCPV